MSINAINSLSSTSTMNSASTTTLANTSAKTNEQFMMILLAQLRNQNPMEPMKDNELMAQMTSLNSLQELQTIKAKMEQMAGANSASYAASLIGKKVKALMPDGTTEEGLVTGTLFGGGLYLLEVNNKQVSLASVVQVTTATPPTTPTTTTPVNPPPAFAQPTGGNEYPNP